MGSHPRLAVALAVALTAAVAAPLGGWLALRVGPPSGETVGQQYRCPMHPAVVQDHPGSCPICGMKLVLAEAAPVKTDASTADGLATVEIDAAKQQLIGLRTAVVDHGAVGGALRTVGRVSVDETQVRRVSSKVPGYVERIFVDFIGRPVRKGQPLYSLYSPEVLAAENEYLLALKSSGALGAATKRKLELWDVPESELQRLAREGTVAKSVTFLSPFSGVVTRKEIAEGARLEAGAMPYEIVDLSTVWVQAEVYETDLRFLSAGLNATLRLTAFPDRTYSGKVLFLDPQLDPKTRTVRLRLSFPNPAGELRPEMFAAVTIERPTRDVLRVPSDALVRNGEEDVVFVLRGEGRFEPRRVQVGEVGREFTEVVDGLTGGEAVVTRANFLVDSESRLRASLSAAKSAEASPAHRGHQGIP